MTLDSKESVLSRWSRRKFEADKSPAPQAQDAPPEILAEPPAETPPVLTDADMPPIESLDEGSDFSGFMSEGVSDELRNLALRKLFRAPVFNIRDGLDEYDEDYTSFEKLGDIVTSDMKHRIEMQEQKLREKLAAENEAGEQPAAAPENADGEDEVEQATVAVAAASPELDAEVDPLVNPGKAAADEQ